MSTTVLVQLVAGLILTLITGAELLVRRASCLILVYVYLTL